MGIGYHAFTASKANGKPERGTPSHYVHLEKPHEEAEASPMLSEAPTSCLLSPSRLSISCHRQRRGKP